MMQRRFLKASRNIGFSWTLSALALNVAGTSFSVFFQKNGTKPHRIGTSSRPLPRSTITSTIVVGAML